MKVKTIKEIARIGGKARWAKIAKEERSKIMTRVSRSRRLKKRYDKNTITTK